MESHTLMKMINFFLYVFFFLSGSAALIYQIVWQRLLFTLFGIDLTSITIIVSVFMFGLGIGGILGGIISDRMRTRLLALYVGIELGIAIFGYLSPTIISFVGNATLSANEWQVGLVSFFILIFPTMLMGATFPILVTYVSTFDKSIGEAVGSLYFANTLGGALGVLMAGFFLLHYFDLLDIVHIAASINLFITLMAYWVFKR
jgi:predicted membrane-bound spermidine synthase